MLVNEHWLNTGGEERHERQDLQRSRRDGLVGAIDKLRIASASSDGSHEVAERLRAGEPLFRDRPEGSSPHRHVLLNRRHDGGHNTVFGVPESVFGKRIHCFSSFSVHVSNGGFRLRAPITLVFNAR